MQIKITVPEPLKRAWTENPLAVIGVGAAAVASIAKLLDAVSASKGRKAYAQQVKNSSRRLK